jgi:hypothetical protein
MTKFLILLLPSFAVATTTSLAPTPIFLKAGFSAVLEFDDTPTRIVLGDAQSFQVEKLDKSLAVRSLVPYATTNMFVYFKARDPRLFILTASEDAEPTFYRKFVAMANVVTPAKEPLKPVQPKQSVRVLSAKFDGKKDYLTVELEVRANSSGPVKPNWNLARLSYARSTVKPLKLWAERQEVQKDSVVKARFVFAKPNISKNLSGVNLILPVHGDTKSLVIALGGGR